MSAAGAGADGRSPAPCPRCDWPTFPDEQFCGQCGMPLGAMAAAPATARQGGPETHQRGAQDLGNVAVVTDRGRRRQRNEDAFAIFSAPPRAVLAVCDGVASTSNSFRASQVAAAAAARALQPLLAPGAGTDTGSADAVVRAAVDRAQDAVAALPASGPDSQALPASTTLVAAAALPGRLVVASVGDSRAYWLPDSRAGARMLTTDDTWARERIADGIPADVANAHPDAHTLTRWLGVDADVIDPHVSFLDVDEAGVLVVCSDGLWTYFEDASAMSAVAGTAADGTPYALAEHLVDAALQAGGHDNVTVAVVRVEPAAAPAGPPAPPAPATPAPATPAPATPAPGTPAPGPAAPPQE